MLILIDQDGVLADFERGFHAAWNAKGHEHPILPVHERRTFYIRDDYPTHIRQEVEAVYTAPGFFRELPPVEGAIEALSELMKLGHEVRICTSPLNQYRHCLPEKYEWIERHLGPDFVSRMIVTKDKTLIQGDILIDDNPMVNGLRPASWKHVIFDQPYNRHVDGPRMTWKNWREILVPHNSGVDHE